MSNRASLIAVAAVVAVVAAVAAGSGWWLWQVEARETPAAYTPTATVKDLMNAVVDPSADDVWNAVTTTVTSNSTDEKAPHTDQEWAGVRNGALRLVEGANLLMMPGRHMARPGEKSETPGVELEPQEMEVLMNQDRAAWNARARALQSVSLELLRAVDARDARRLFDAGDRLDMACENCHRQYWYPNEHIPDLPPDPAPTAAQPPAAK